MAERLQMSIDPAWVDACDGPRQPCPYALDASLEQQHIDIDLDA